MKNVLKIVSDVCRKSRLKLTLSTVLLGALVISAATTYYASPTGTGDGLTAATPASLTSVQTKVRAATSGMTGDIIVQLRGGTYALTSTLTLTAQDGGTNGHNVIYQNYPGEIPVISGGTQVTGWTVSDAAKGIYSANVGMSVDTRQLYVNGVRAVRARSIDGPAWTESGDGYTCPADVATWKNITAVEVCSDIEWHSHKGHISSVSGTHATMRTAWWNSIHGSNMGGVQKGFWIENAYELLDTTGEWYLNRTTGVLYYKPRTNENMSTAVVIMPLLERLISGTNVANIQFYGIRFSYATWLWPNTNDIANGQGDMVVGYGTQMEGNIRFDGSSTMRFEKCIFEHLGRGGLQFATGCSNNVIYNNTFQDISGSGISIGVMNNNGTVNNLVDNNYITAAVEYHASVGVFIGYSERTIITHNDIFNLPYSGISMGWSWSASTVVAKNCEVAYNKIDSVMVRLRDGGAIYTLSAQPGTRIHDNYINHVMGEFGGLYPDEGSSNMRWDHNVVRNSPRWLHMWTGTIQYDTVENNYYDNQTATTNGTNCILRNNTYVINNNWPAEALAIMAGAGRNVSYTPTITTTPATTSSVNIGYSYQVVGIGNPAPTLTVTGLPSWLSFNVSTGILSGTPTLANVGTSGTITVTATNSAGSDVQQYAITVVDGAWFMVDDANSAAHYYGNWSHTTGQLYYQKTESFSATTNDSLVFSFTGTGFRMLAFANQYNGIANVFVDRGVAQTADMYSPFGIYLTNVFEVTGLAEGPHTVKIVVSGTKNAGSGGAYLCIDAFAYYTRSSTVAAIPGIMTAHIPKTTRDFYLYSVKGALIKKITSASNNEAGLVRTLTNGIYFVKSVNTTGQIVSKKKVVLK